MSKAGSSFLLSLAATGSLAAAVACSPAVSEPEQAVRPRPERPAAPEPSRPQPPAPDADALIAKLLAAEDAAARDAVAAELGRMRSAAEELAPKLLRLIPADWRDCRSLLAGSKPGGVPEAAADALLAMCDPPETLGPAATAALARAVLEKGVGGAVPMLLRTPTDHRDAAVADILAGAEIHEDIPWVVRSIGLAERGFAWSPVVGDLACYAADGEGETYCRQLAFDRLGDLGPPAGAALPALLSVAANGDDPFSADAAVAAWRIGRRWVVLAPRLKEAATERAVEEVFPDFGRTRLSRLLADIDRDPRLSHLPVVAALLDSENEEVRSYAIRIAGRFGPAAGPLVSKIMRDGKEPGTDEIVALRRIGPAARGALPMLLRAAKDDRPIRYVSVLAIGRIGGVSAIPDLRAMLADDTFADERNRVCTVAAFALGELGPDAAVAVPDILRGFTWFPAGATESIEDESDDAAAAAPDNEPREANSSYDPYAIALSRIGPAALPGVTGFLNHPDARVRWRAMQTIRRMRRLWGPVVETLAGPVARTASFEELDRGRTSVVTRRLRVPPELAAELAARALRHPYGPTGGYGGWAAGSEVELEALAALGPASRAALPDLRRLAKIRPLEPLIRRGAALAIWSIGRDADESLPMLLPLVAEPRFDEPSGCSMTPADMAAFVRPVFEALVETGRPEAVPALAEAALSADPRIRRAAVAALATGRFGRAAAAALPVLMGRVADETDPAVRRAAAEAIARLPTAGGRGPGVSGSRWAGP